MNSSTLVYVILNFQIFFHFLCWKYRVLSINKYGKEQRGHLRPVACHFESSGQRMLIFRVLGNQHTFYFHLLQALDPRIPLKCSCWQLIQCLACNQCSRNIFLIELSFKMLLSPVCLPHYLHLGALPIFADKSFTCSKKSGDC